MLCDDLEVWDGEMCGKEAWEGGNICIFMADMHCCTQKPAQHCTAIILQFKKKFLSVYCCLHTTDESWFLIFQKKNQKLFLNPDAYALHGPTGWSGGGLIPSDALYAKICFFNLVWTLEEEMAIHSSMPSWKIPWMEEAGRLVSMGLQRLKTWLGTRLVRPGPITI